MNTEIFNPNPNPHPYKDQEVLLEDNVVYGIFSNRRVYVIVDEVIQQTETFFQLDITKPNHNFDEYKIIYDQNLNIYYWGLRQDGLPWENNKKFVVNNMGELSIEIPRI